MIAPLTPINRVLTLLPSYRKNASRGGVIAWCPAHDDKHPSLSVWEDSAGRVGFKCYAGCETFDIVGALRLKYRDLYPADSRARYAREKTADQAAFDAAPVETLVSCVDREADLARRRRLERNPHDTRHYRSADINAARAKAADLFGIALSPIARYAWEGYAPLDTDDAWPALFSKAWSLVAIDALPEGAVFDLGVPIPRSLHPAAADIASRWLRQLERAAYRDLSAEEDAS